MHSLPKGKVVYNVPANPKHPEWEKGGFQHLQALDTEFIIQIRLNSPINCHLGKEKQTQAWGE